MAFFLLGRTADGTLSLLSDATFESRQDALAELSQITGDPDFSSWEDDVVLIDLDSGTPVLLVRPYAPAASDVPVPTPDALPEPAAFAAIADEDLRVVPVTAVEAQCGELQADSDEREEDHAAVAVAAAEPQNEVATTVVANPEDSAEPTAEGEAEEEAESGPVLDAAPELLPHDDRPPTDEVAEVDDADVANPENSLRDAIARTTEHMEASGIVAPTSIASAFEPAEPLADDPDPQAPARAAAPDEEHATQEDELPKWPWSSPPRSTPASTAGSEASDVDVEFLLEGLEEPAIDGGGSLITSAIDDAALSASRPIILGAYGGLPDVTEEEDPSGESHVQAQEDADDVLVQEGAPEEESDFIVLDPSPESPDSPEVAQEPEVAQVAVEPEFSVPAQTPATPDGGPDDVLSLSTYTCEDCVYVETCPNKDQRRPEDCGSFQWK